jgi:hypothetical protein
MRTTTFQSYHPPSQLQMAPAQSPDGQGQVSPPVSIKNSSCSSSPDLHSILATSNPSPSITIIQDATHASSSQSPPQPSSSSAHQLPPITAASPAILSNTDPNASLQSILTNSRNDSTPHNGQLPTWSIQAASVHSVPHPHHPVGPIVSQVGKPHEKLVYVSLYYIL